jgi:hypothetical protein
MFNSNLNVQQNSEKQLNTQKANPFLSSINTPLGSNDMIISPVLSPQLKPTETLAPPNFNLNNNAMDINNSASNNIY